MAYQPSKPENMFNIIKQIVIEQGIDDDTFHRSVQDLANFYENNRSIEIGESCDKQLEYENLKWTYLYRYFTCIANACKVHWLHHYSCKEDTINALLQTENINICCLGGGPGTDLIAFYLFLQEIKIDIKVNVWILDKEDWSDQIDQVLERFAPDLISRTNYMKYDVFDQLDSNSEIYKTLHNADIVSMVKFVSEFAHGPWDESSDGPVEMRVTNKLMPVFGALKPEAMVFYLDNSGGGYTEAFNVAAKAVVLINISENLFDEFAMDYPANFVSIGREYPTKKLGISSTLWQKPY